MTKENDKIKFTLRMDAQQKRKLTRLAENAGVSQSRYLLGLLDGVSFQPRPPRAFWDLMKELYSLHKLLVQFGQEQPIFLRAANALELFTERFQKAMTEPEEVP